MACKLIKGFDKCVANKFRARWANASLTICSELSRALSHAECYIHPKIGTIITDSTLELTCTMAYIALRSLTDAFPKIVVYHCYGSAFTVNRIGIKLYIGRRAFEARVRFKGLALGTQLVVAKLTVTCSSTVTATTRVAL